MKIHRLAIFLFVSISSGLAAAFIVLLLRPELVAPPTAAPPPAPAGPAVASYAAAVGRAAPSVVNIYSTKLVATRPAPTFDHPLLERFFGERSEAPQLRRENSLGSGVIMDAKGFVLTNHHVVADASEIRLVLNDGREAEARVLGSDPETDIAVLHVDADGLTPATTTGSGVRVGDVVLAIGNPFAVGQTVTMGIVSATGRSELGITNFEDFIQTDAAINPGNSGGALINSAGEVVGINTAIFSRSGGSHGIGFAIPVGKAAQVMAQIVREGRVVRGWLGISGQDMNDALAASLGLPSADGVVVAGVLADGPADLAGIVPGDVILAIDDTAVATSRQVLEIIAARQPGARVSLRINRRDGERTLVATITERPRILPAQR